MFAGLCRDNGKQSELWSLESFPHHTQPIFIAGKYLWVILTCSIDICSTLGTGPPKFFLGI